MVPSDALIKFVVCENAREDKDGKVSLLGVYPDDKIILPADARFPASFSLSLVFFLLDGSGGFSGDLEIKMPQDQIEFSGDSIRVEKEEGKPASILAVFLPFVATSFGKYQATLTLDRQTYIRYFEVLPRPF